MNECIFIWENTRTVQGINDVDDVFVQRTSETKKTYSTEQVGNDASARSPNQLLRCRVTLRFDLLTTIDRFTVDHFCQFAANSVHSFSKYLVHKFSNRRTNGRMNEQTNEHVENV